MWYYIIGIPVAVILGLLLLVSVVEGVIFGIKNRDWLD